MANNDFTVAILGGVAAGFLQGRKERRRKFEFGEEVKLKKLQIEKSSEQSAQLLTLQEKIDNLNARTQGAQAGTQKTRFQTVTDAFTPIKKNNATISDNNLDLAKFLEKVKAGPISIEDQAEVSRLQEENRTLRAENAASMGVLAEQGIKIPDAPEVPAPKKEVVTPQSRTANLIDKQLEGTRSDEPDQTFVNMRAQINQALKNNEMSEAEALRKGAEINKKRSQAEATRNAQAAGLIPTPQQQPDVFGPPDSVPGQ